MRKTERFWRQRCIATSALVLLHLVAIGCSKGPSEANEARQTVDIGAILPLTGALSYFGDHQRNAINLALAHLKADSNLQYSYEVIFEDHKNTPSLAVSQFQRLYNIHGVRHFITQMSPVSMALAPVARDSQAILVSLAMHPGFAPQGKTLFRIYDSISQQSVALAEFITMSRDERSIAVIYINDVWGAESEAAFSERFASLGGMVSSRQAYDPQVSNYRDLIARAMESRPDAVYVSGYGPSAVNIVKQIRDVSDIQLFGNIGLSWDFSFSAGGSALIDLVVAMPEFLAQEQSDNKFVIDYISMHGSNPNMESAFTYDAIMFIARGIEAAGPTNTQQFAEYMLTLRSFKGVSGTIVLDQDGNASMERTAIRKWTDAGELKTLKFMESMLERE